MTDITELALLVSKAKASVFTLEYISQFEPADIDSDDVDLRFEVDGRDTGTNVSIVDECGQAARVISALVEALEKAQQYSKERDAENQNLMLTVGRLRVEREELESRTVKLTKLKMLEDYLAEVAIEERKQILVGVKLEFHRACAAADIKVEAE
ncbi:TPA: ead/Ea22-like family protein [Raoultella ornithinolytica]|nr:ead/Ea22-like family protein [Raoultella ornithinolytica]